MVAFDHETFETYTPTKQRSAREQAALGVCLPFWVHDLDAPVTYHMHLLVLSPEELNQLVIFARKEAARVNPNPLDNRDNLDYNPSNKEKHAVIRHTCLNRTPGNSNMLGGYMHSYDNLMHRIEKKGIDVEARQMQLRRHVCALIDTYYPELKLESAEYLWRYETGRLRGQKQ